MLLSPSFIKTASFSVSITGLLLIALLSVVLEPQEVSIKEINDGFEGKANRTRGLVRNSFQLRNVLMLELYDAKKIKAVKFNPSEADFEVLKKNSFAEIQGRVQRYNGELEIVVSGARKIA